MYYSELVEIYEKLYSTSKRLEKTTILADFLHKLKSHSKWIYLLRGKVLPDYDDREFGISKQLAIKAIASSFGMKSSEVHNEFRKIGDLGEITEDFAEKTRQSKLFYSRLSIEKVFENLKKLVDIEGKGSVGKKIDLISELLGHASGKESKYIVRTLLGDLRVGVADGILRDSINEAFFKNEKKEMSEKIEAAFDMVNDWANVFEAAKKGKKEINKIEIVPGRAINVMLAIKVENIDDAFKACGKPAAVEHKYDGFRLVISKNNGEIKLFTRRLENVTKQFPDVVESIEKNIQGKDFILDSEVVGYAKIYDGVLDASKFKKTEKKLKNNSKNERYRYLPFEAISQRIRRKYNIDKLKKKLPVEVNIFDVLYHNGKSFMNEKFKNRRKLLEKIVRNSVWKIRLAQQIITSDKEEAMKFYKKALELGEEGVMIKNLNAKYRQGRRVGYMVKMKPEVKDLDLVIVGAEWGSGKRGGLLTSYILACKSGEKFLEIGKVSSGLKEKESEGMTYNQMTKLLKNLIIKENDKKVFVNPKIIVSVTYQNIQKSPNYNSGYALRFPRITKYRPDRNVKDIVSLDEIKREIVGRKN